MGNPSERDTEAQRQEKQMAEAILQYLAEHPHAMDTLEGIAEWWIMRQQVRVQVERVANAVRQLTEQGILEEVRIGQTIHYRRKEGRRP